MEEMDYVSLSSEPPNSCEADMQVDDHFPSSTNECSSKAENQEKKDEPELGMEFSSNEGAYKFYLNYGGKLGFKVRRNHQRKNAKGLISRVTFCCSKEGKRREDKRYNGKKPLYHQPITRVGCVAHMTCLLQKNGKFKVVSLEKSHNHELIRRAPTENMLRVNRSISKAQKAHAEDAHRSGLPIRETMELMSREVGGSEHVGFLYEDFPNYIHRKRKMAMEKGDAGAILEYFHNMQVNDSSFFYSIQLDEDDMITNIFWADARSVSDYGLFGDVVCFDTTYRTNEYGRPFAPFVGVNHHKKGVVFGAALLYDETTESFRWLFETFLGAMSGKQPKTILSDQSVAMEKAISDVFFESQHRLSVCHIYQTAAKNLSHVFHGSEQFVHEFGNCLFDYEDEDEDKWLLAWNSMLEKYSLKENAWLKELFEVREKWAMVYGRHTFTADMTSTQCSEIMNNVLKNYLKLKHDLLHFCEHYERVLNDRRYEELLADLKMMQTMPTLLISAEMLRHGAEIYTPEVFELFQKEYMRWGDYNIYKVGKEGTKVEYKVSCVGKSEEHVVKFEASTQTVTCSCMKFTFIGILCAHALKVLDKKNIKRIPPQYIMKRWTRDAKARTISNYHGIEANVCPKKSAGKRYSHLCRNFREISSLASEHELLYAYANERALLLLNDLEEMKKKIYSEQFKRWPIQ
ncbi:protein FAR1-RELATED SEQUENCE 5-like [Cornus florida]|uniref:protein FAR1-RELATED SEQUENCE 5-like n=1 Tax=Cornus florida TaxID=4283 RepID=UPI00289B2071|nr:protein FAR1-RELATED SEQUENCE 5-like [Cornus florida]